MFSEDVRVRLCQQDLVKMGLNINYIIQTISDSLTTTDALDILNQEIQEKISLFRSRVEELELLAGDQDNEDELQLILTHVNNHRSQLDYSLKHLRRINLKAKETLAISMRNELLQSSKLRNRNDAKQQKLKSTGDVTKRMLDITRLMSVQAKHGDDTADVMLHSSQKIEETNQEMKSMTGHLSKTHKLMSKYGRRETTDKMLIGAAFFFFTCCALSIIKNRIFPNLF